ncbi:hypothetical protein GGR57DRAFT_263354 [Xylariaceae sp. FL1272]|nr:hypothetical protein GGR57DRAFT_263354 [Xylariaceae sp. FL1272]
MSPIMILSVVGMTKNGMIGLLCFVLATPPSVVLRSHEQVVNRAQGKLWVYELAARHSCLFTSPRSLSSSLSLQASFKRLCSTLGLSIAIATSL